jgi:hexosaminidase
MKRFFSVLFGIALLLLSQHASAQDKDFVVKGFHLDMRIQVMKMDALKTFAKK